MDKQMFKMEKGEGTTGKANRVHEKLKGKETPHTSRETGLRSEHGQLIHYSRRKI